MKKRDDVLVGLVIAVAIIVAIIGSLWLARGGLSKGYPLYAKFPWSAGLKQGQPVLLGGVNIGYVDEVDQVVFVRHVDQVEAQIHRAQVETLSDTEHAHTEVLAARDGGAASFPTGDD